MSCKHVQLDHIILCAKHACSLLSEDVSREDGNNIEGDLKIMKAEGCEVIVLFR